MNKFKFGDRVRIKQKYGYGDGIFLIRCLRKQNDEEVALLVHSKGYFAESVPTEWLELIPHPDTARLDYIQKNFSEIRVCEDEYERFFTLHEDGEDWLKIGRVNVRELIDMAIAEQSE